MDLPFAGKTPSFGPGLTGPRNEIIALAAVLLLAVLSWQMINGVATALYRQYEVLGDPALVLIEVAGPELGQKGPPARPPSQLGHVGYFWSERAFHYRCALMFAVNDYQDPAVLSRDTWQQHPDGVNAWRQYALLMEPVYGFLYRLAGDQARPFVEFLLRLVPLIHVLIFFPLYGVARALGCRRLLAVLGVVFYATCTLGFVRMTGSLLLKEDFALLCLAVFLAVHFWAWRRESLPLAVLAAVLLVPVLAAWHLSQFLVLVVVLAAAIGWTFIARKEAPAKGRIPFSILMPAAYTLAGLAAGFTPSLLARGFFLSLPMAVLYAWTITAVAAHRRRGLGNSIPLRFLVFAGLVVVLGGLVFLNRGYTGDYNHVFGLFVQKIVHGFRLPDDPGLLPFDSRVFWAPPFNTPTWGEIWAKLGFHIAVLLPVLIWCIWTILRRTTDALHRSFLMTVPAYLAAYLMIERLGIVFLLFAAVTVAMAGEWLVRRMTSRAGSGALPVVVGLLMISPVLNLNGNLGDMIKITREVRQGHEVRLEASDQALWESWSGMFTWLTVHTPGPGSRLPGSAAAVLGEIGVSTQLLLYTGRPIVLNSQFENAEIRDRYRRFLEALYSTDEMVLWEFAKQYGADYIFINRNFATRTGPGSSPFLAGVTGNLGLEMNVVKMHFRPEVLSRFTPVYDNEYYRILRVLPEARKRPSMAWKSDFNSWWQLENFRVQEGDLVDLAGDRERLGTFEVVLSDLQDRQRDILAAVEKHWQSSHGTGARRPDLMLLHRKYVQALLDRMSPGAGGDSKVGRLANTIRARLSEIDPLSGQPLETALATLAYGTDGWLDQLSSHAGEPLHHATCGQLLALSGRYAEAADQFGLASAFFPEPGQGTSRQRPQEMQIRLWQEEVWWNIAAAKNGRARDLARRYAVHTRPASPEGAFFLKVEAIPWEYE